MDSIGSAFGENFICSFETEESFKLKFGENYTFSVATEESIKDFGIDLDELKKEKPGERDFLSKNIEEFKIEIIKIENKIKESLASHNDENLRKYRIDLHNVKAMLESDEWRLNKLLKN
jgi:hypothetical protein